MKINRNDACSCGSKKKYKHCCGSGNISSNGEKNQLVRGLILTAMLLVTSLAIYSVVEFYQEDRPEMEAYTCDNPNCGKIHYRPVSSPTENN